MLDKLLILFFTITVISSHAQPCELSVIGQVVDKNTQQPIEFATIYLEELKRGAISDIDGNFEIEKLCAGDYHMVVSHIGCETQRIFFQLKRDTNWTIKVEHSNQLLNEVTIENHVQESQSQEVEVV